MTEEEFNLSEKNFIRDSLRGLGLKEKLIDFIFYLFEDKEKEFISKDYDNLMLLFRKHISWKEYFERRNKLAGVKLSNA